MTEFSIPAPPTIVRKAERPRPMQFAIVPLRAIADKRLTDRQVRMLALVASYSNRAGISWASQERMGRDVGISQAGMGKHIRNLVALGYIEKIGGYKRAVKGWTYRILFDPKLSADEADALANTPEEGDMAGFRYGQPMPAGAFIGDVAESLERIQAKKRGRPKKHTDANPAEPQAVTQDREAHTAEEYVRAYCQSYAKACGIERVPNETDRAVAARLAAAGVPLVRWQALLAESLAWHRDTGRAPPAGMGYWLAVALQG